MNRNEMKLNGMDTTGRFSDRVTDYDLYRPSYPSALMDYLDQVSQLRGARVADVGAGTGIFSKLLLDRGAVVDVIEPNAEMGRAATKNLGERQGFHFWPGTAEKTGLPDRSVDLITCAQAFHWFEVSEARKEFDRILKKQGCIALIWNDQKKEIGLGHAYEQLKLEYGGAEFKKVSEVTNAIDEFFPDFFGAASYETKFFDNYQELDETGFIGRFFSSSWAPKPNTAMAEEAKTALIEIFRKYQKGERVRLEYKTELFLSAQ